MNNTETTKRQKELAIEHLNRIIADCKTKAESIVTDMLIEIQAAKMKATTRMEPIDIKKNKALLRINKIT